MLSNPMLLSRDTSGGGGGGVDVGVGLFLAWEDFGRMFDNSFPACTFFFFFFLGG